MSPKGTRIPHKNENENDIVVAHLLSEIGIRERDVYVGNAWKFRAIMGQREDNSVPT